MKKSSVLSAVVLSVALLSSNAHASGGGFADFWQKIVSYFQTTIEKKKEIYQGEQHHYTHSWEGYSHNNWSGHKNVPEMDAAGAGLTLGLLASLIAIRRERKKRSGPSKPD